VPTRDVTYPYDRHMDIVMLIIGVLGLIAAALAAWFAYSAWKAYRAKRICDSWSTKDRRRARWVMFRFQNDGDGAAAHWIVTIDHG
jgi:hypothetical protein